MKWNNRQRICQVAAAVILAGCTPTSTNIHQCPPARTVEARLFRVVRIIDGDTFVVVYDERATSVRPPRIDAPERGRPGAAAALAELIGGRTVRLEFSDPAGRKRDRWGRLLASVYVMIDGVEVDVEAELLRRGRSNPTAGEVHREQIHRRRLAEDLADAFPGVPVPPRRDGRLPAAPPRLGHPRDLGRGDLRHPPRLAGPRQGRIRRTSRAHDCPSSPVARAMASRAASTRYQHSAGVGPSTQRAGRVLHVVRPVIIWEVLEQPAAGVQQVRVGVDGAGVDFVNGGLDLRFGHGFAVGVDNVATPFVVEHRANVLTSVGYGPILTAGLGRVALDCAPGQTVEFSDTESVFVVCVHP